MGRARGAAHEKRENETKKGVWSQTLRHDGGGGREPRRDDKTGRPKLKVLLLGPHYIYFIF